MTPRLYSLWKAPVRTGLSFTLCVSARTRRQVWRWSVGHDRPTSGSWQVPAHRTSRLAGRGAYAFRALPDLCLRERGLLVRRDGDALGGSLDQLGNVLVVVLANNMTAR